MSDPDPWIDPETGPDVPPEEPPKALSARKRSWRKRLGDAGERDAARMLEQKGYTVLHRKCRTPKGEIDLVCLDGASYVFVEVKTRYCHFHQFGSRPDPWRNLSEAQKSRIRKGAVSYLRELGEDGANRLYRFDLVEVLRGPFGPLAIRHHVNILDPGRRSPQGIPGRVFRRNKDSATETMFFPVE